MIDIESILSSLREIPVLVIKTMASYVDIKDGPTYSGVENPLLGDISGNIGITGELSLSLTVSFSMGAIMTIYNAVFPYDENPDIDKHIKDFVGELTNMIAGNFKNYAAEFGMEFESSIPMVIVGPQRIYHPTGSITKVISFDVNGNLMFVEVGIRLDQ